jgi:PAS domain S-box-containing protein
MESPGSLAELSRLFNLSLDILCISSSDGYFKLVNPAFTSTLGWSEEELLSRPYMSFVHPDDVDSTRRNVERQVVAGEKTLCFENRYRHKAGSWRLLEWTSMPQSDGLMYATARDITERKRAEERIRLFTHELIAVREEEKQRVSSVLHHDVGSLAVGLSAHFDALEDGIRCGKTREAIKWMKRTRNLFDQSLVRLKELAVELRPPELDLLGLSAALRHHFSQVTGLGNVRIHFVQNLGKRRLPGEVATVVFRIIQEALTNAIKHGGAKRVDVRMSASKKKLSFSVRDDGKGFRPAQGTGRSLAIWAFV